jgi:hypothetical protein
MMQELERLLGERDIEFDAQDRRIMCFPHIINICVKHVLDTDPADLADAFVGAFAGDNDSDDDSDEFKKKYLEALNHNPIALGRQTVKAIRASGLRRDEFTHVIRSCNSSGLFKFQGKVVQVPEYQLLRDVHTRWDSVYFMINRLRAMRVVCFFIIIMIQVHFSQSLWQAIDFFLSSPDQQDIVHHKMDAMEWFVLRDFEVILEVSILILMLKLVDFSPRRYLMGFNRVCLVRAVLGWAMLYHTWSCS